MLKYVFALLIAFCFTSAHASSSSRTLCNNEADILTFAVVGTDGAFLELCFDERKNEVSYFTRSIKGKITEERLKVEDVTYISVPGKENRLTGYILRHPTHETFIAKMSVLDETFSEIQYWAKDELIGIMTLNSTKVYMHANKAFVPSTELPH